MTQPHCLLIEVVPELSRTESRERKEGERFVGWAVMESILLQAKTLQPLRMGLLEMTHILTAAAFPPSSAPRLGVGGLLQFPSLLLFSPFSPLFLTCYRAAGVGTEVCVLPERWSSSSVIRRHAN